MATYVVLFNWTEQGIKNFKDSPSRADAAREALGGQGVTIGEIYWTIGPYDLVSIVEAPDDETLTAGLLQLAAGGNVRSTTMRAFTQAEFTGVIGRTG
ncbi:MAG TPA: GYD domain-containing protein [Gaiellaceae bacterium]|jgi:uncharacterized protein with GYD domain